MAKQAAMPNEETNCRSRGQRCRYSSELSSAFWSGKVITCLLTVPERCFALHAFRYGDAGTCSSEQTVMVRCVSFRLWPQAPAVFGMLIKQEENKLSSHRVAPYGRITSSVLCYPIVPPP